VEVLVVGAGQAGLSAAYTLHRRGGAWRHRWPSLTLGRTHHIHDLPGLPLGTPDPDEPASAVVARYYGDYERRFGLPVHRPVRVRAVTSADGPLGPLLVDTDHGPWRTRRLVSATGTWDRPHWPAYPGRELFRGRQLHTHDFRSVEDFRGQHVVVVGGGTSAVQFLLELDGVASTTWVTRRPPDFTPRAFDQEWGRDVERRVAIGSGVLVAREMFSSITEDGVRFADGTEVRGNAILWATGFRASLDHLAPLRLREPGGGITVHGTTVVKDPRVHLVGYGPSASTLGANRAGRVAAHASLAA
jgi:cation diffusion facilitator CzcD-associated flavoprotein CzcO